MGAVASVALLALAVCDPRADESERPVVEKEEHHFEPWSGWDSESPEAVEGREYVISDAVGRWVRFVDSEGRGRPVATLMGAPGMWPFLRQDSKEGGEVQLASYDSSRMDGGELRLYEILARHQPGDELDEGEASKGFWGLVHGPQDEGTAKEATSVTLQEATALEMQMVDEEGQPIDEAYVRLARDSVALVHLVKSTGEDGQVLFDAIPPGEYYVTIDADGFAQRRLRVPHGEPGWEGIQITLEDGGGVRKPESWRGPSVAEMVERSSGESATSGETSSGAQRSSEEPQRSSEEPQRSSEESQGEPVELRIADGRGGGVSGALVEAWVDGEAVDQAVSRGRESIRLHVPAGRPIDLVANHAGWGEGHHRLESASEADGLVIRLRDDRGDEVVSRGRIWDRSKVEEVIDARVIVSGRQWLIDPRRGGAAEQAGVERGDALVIFEEAGRLVVDRDGEIVELQISG